MNLMSTQELKESSITMTNKANSTINQSNAQISYQKDIKKRTAHLRQALHKADDESALIFRSLPTITNSSSHKNKQTKAIASEADELVHHLSNTLSRWRRTSTLAAETFAELLAETSRDKETNIEMESAIKQADSEIQTLWMTTTRIQAEIDFVEELLSRESRSIMDMKNATYPNSTTSASSSHSMSSAYSMTGYR